MAHGDERNGLARALDTAGWGLFFIWIGIAFLADVGWGIGLLGAGVIGLALQGVRRYRGLPFDGFGLVVSLLLALAGGWDMLELQVGEGGLRGLLPGVSVVVGIVLLWSAVRGRGRR